MNGLLKKKRFGIFLENIKRKGLKGMIPNKDKSKQVKTFKGNANDTKYNEMEMCKMKQI